MKRHAIALVIHPYKNALLPRALLARQLNDFAKTVIEAGVSFQNVRFNLALPGFFLEILDPLLLLQLREMYKRNQIEWLFTGYTEPFLSFSPPWLLSENFKYGMQTFSELAGAAPSGLLVPYSNWEPSAIDILRGAGINYCVLSKSSLPPEYRSYCGYWTTEHMGSAMAFFPSQVVSAIASERLLNSLDAQFDADPRKTFPTKIICVDVLHDLARGSAETLDAIKQTLRALDTMLLSYQPMRCSEFLSSHFTLGLHYMPPSLAMERDARDGDPYFLNRLHAYDQAGIIQRKLMDVAENLAGRKETKSFESLKKTLFFVQDINRFLPSRSSGFLQASDRLWCYEKLIDIERTLHDKDEIKGGHIRITDFLKNGTKTLIMANNNLSLFIDYKNGGQVFEIDYKSRNFNACAALNPCRHTMPMIVECPHSKTGFVDHCLTPATGMQEFWNTSGLELGDFVTGDFGYKVKKTATGIKAVLSRNGTLIQADKNCPLTMEKVIGLEKDHAEISFVYQLSNHSLTPYSLRFAVESTFVLPGIGREMARITRGKDDYSDLGKNPFSLSHVTEWTLDDAYSGVRMHFNVQKPIDVWCFPVRAAEEAEDASHAVTLVINAEVNLEGAKAWTLMGTLGFKKLRIKKEPSDEI
jgi:hypothetical protein